MLFRQRSEDGRERGKEERNERTTVSLIKCQQCPTYTRAGAKQPDSAATFLAALAPLSGDAHLLEGRMDLIPAVFLLLASKALKTSLSYVTCLKMKT